MADYIFEVPLSNEGRDIVTDPYVVDAILSKGVDMIPRVTYNNLNVESIGFDSETKQVYYGITASPQMKLGLASLDVTESLAWWNTLLTGVAIAGAVVCVVAFGVPAIVPAAVVIGAALAYDLLTGYVEVQATKADTQKEIADAVVDGRITPEEGNDLLDGVNEGWDTGIPWTTIIVGGMIGVGALATLYIFMKR